MAGNHTFQNEAMLLRKCIRDEEENVKMRDELESEIELKNFTKQTFLKLEGEAIVYKVTGPVRYQQPIEVVMAELDTKINNLTSKLHHCKDRLENIKARKEFQKKKLISMMSP